MGSLLGVPQWVVELTPFAHVGLVPSEPFRAVAATVLISIGAIAALAALGLFRRRDVVAS